MLADFKELKAQKAAPTFGFVKEILDSDFLDEVTLKFILKKKPLCFNNQVDKEDPRVFIIIHLYDTSVMVNLLLLYVVFENLIFMSAKCADESFAG